MGEPDAQHIITLESQLGLLDGCYCWEHDVGGLEDTKFADINFVPAVSLAFLTYNVQNPIMGTVRLYPPQSYTLW